MKLKLQVQFNNTNVDANDIEVEDDGTVVVYTDMLAQDDIFFCVFVDEKCRYWV